MGKSNAERQRDYRARRLAEIAQMALIPCACGCGQMIPPINKQLKPARFAHGHNRPGAASRFQPGHRPIWMGDSELKASVFARVGAAHAGKKLPQAQLKMRAETRLARNGGAWQVKRGWKHSRETIERMRLANRAHALLGEKNPAWEGGRSFLPYDTNFSREIKRAILRRDNYECADCGCLIGRRKGARRANIHHLDFTKENSGPENLISLCTPCHMKRHWQARLRARKE